MAASHPPSLEPTLLRLVPALERTIQTNPHLPGCALERNKLNANIEYARTLLLTQERYAATLPVQSERARVQADLKILRERIKRLGLKMGQLEDAAAAGEEEESEEEEEEEEKEGGGGVMETYAPARKDVQAGLEAGGGGGGSGEGKENADRHSSLPQDDGLRSRRPLQASDDNNKPNDKLSSTATSTARAQLFSARPLQNATNPTISLHETLLTHHRHEQDALTSSLVALARELKTSAQNLGAGLAEEKHEVLGRAAGALDASAQGMEAAQVRMGRLRRMAEGQGWWGRVKLYAMIVGLWVACFGVVFVGPKLRV